MLRGPLLTLLAAAILGGCGSRDSQLACEPADRYATAGSIDPVRIPDDLSPPDETSALRVPQPAAGARAQNGCLETPPEFFEGGVGREAPGEAAPAQPVEPAPGGDRQITN